VLAKVPDFVKFNPLIGPQWRADRARILVARNQRPQPFDDGYIRAYRKLLLANKNGNGPAAYLESPHAYIANSINEFPDSEWRDILQAKLLTQESLQDIAGWIGTDEQVIDFFEKVFFNVKDRLDNKGWIIKVIIGSTDDRATNDMGTMTDPQRAVVYRLFAYYGGSEALEATITGLMPSSLPSSKKDIEKWFETALEQIIQSRATQAARVMQINKFNIMQILELAVTGSREKLDGSSSSGARFDEFAEKVTGVVGNWGMAEKSFRRMSEDKQTRVTSAIELRVEEQMLVDQGSYPDTLATDEQRIDTARLQLEHVEEPVQEQT
jgi:hypothetical protein